MADVIGGILKAAKSGIKARRAAKEAEKMYQSSANVAERSRKASDLTKAASEVKGAKKFAGKKGFKRGVAVGVAGSIAGEFLRKNKVSISTTPRDAAPKKKKAVKKKTAKTSTKRYTF